MVLESFIVFDAVKPVYLKLGKHFGVFQANRIKITSDESFVQEFKSI